MDVVDIEIVTHEQADNFVREARRQNRAERRRILEMSGRVVVDLLAQDLSELRAQNALAEWRPVSVLVPRNQSPEEILELFIETNREGYSLLVHFSYGPSKRFLGDLRSAAKRRNVKLHIYRLLRSMAIIELENREGADKEFLKSLGVIWQR